MSFRLWFFFTKLDMKTLNILHTFSPEDRLLQLRGINDITGKLLLPSCPVQCVFACVWTSYLSFVMRNAVSDLCVLDALVRMGYCFTCELQRKSLHAPLCGWVCMIACMHLCTCLQVPVFMIVYKTPQQDSRIPLPALACGTMTSLCQFCCFGFHPV